MRKFYSIFALCAFLFLSVSIQATEVTISDSGTTNSQILPIALQGTSEFMPKYSISQEIYLAEELLANGAFIGDITAIKYYYPHTANSTETRNLQVWIMESDLDEFSMTADDPGQLVYDAEYKAGTLVYQGAQTLSKSDYTITFNKNGGKFHWNGSKNIIITVYDETGTACAVNRHRLMATSAPRFLHQTTYNSSPTWNMSDLRNTAAKSYNSSESEIIGHKYVNKITFTFGAAPEPPATPTDLSVSAAITSATLSWSGVLGATSYDLQQSADGESWSTLSSGETGTSYNWTGLSAASTHYARIRANNAVGSSEWSDAVTVTTDAVHEHNGITFDKWSSTNSLPSEAGNYYLNADVTLPNHYTLPGNINLCLNGHNLYTYAYRIVVPDQKTFAVYNTSDEGMISGAYEAYLTGGQITVDAGGTLILGDKCKVQNIAEPEESGYVSYAIANAGTLRLSGAPVISGTTADIYLSSSNITLVGALTNSSSNKYSVNKLASDFTSGWSTYMEGENPSDHFTSANNSYGGICYNPSTGEARIVKALNFADNADNTSTMSTYTGQLTNVTIGRSFTSASFNTISLPFPLTDAQLEEIFGADYDLEEFVSSEIDGDILNLSFNKVTSLVAGKPYLLQPASDVTNPSFEGVTISATSPADQISDEFISFHGTFAPTELTGGNKNLLFLGAENELFWPASTGDIKGFRAYFEVKGAAQKAKAARIVKKEDQAQALDNIENTRPAQKRILNGQLVIEKNGTFYNAQGQIVK